MINLSRHIEYLLLYHDTVAVPQLGTFEATYMPSKWVEEEEILLPPYRALSFKQKIDETDTRLVDTISVNYQISTEEANIVTLEYTENILQELAEYGNYEFGSIGEFVQEDPTGKIRFIPCQAGVATPWLYGLDAVHIHPTKNEEQHLRSQKNKKMSINADTKNINISINKHAFRYIAAIAASIVLFFAFSTPIGENIVSNKQTATSDIFFPNQLITIPKACTENPKAIVKEELTAEETISEETPLEVEKETKPTFSVILCCGVPVQNAESYCQNLNKRGISAVVDNSGKVLRVLIPGFTSREDALAEVHSLRKLSKEFSNVWIMENK